ncbi:MAG TPA: hypothetical protein VHC72_15635, partial [Bryobacteraceae bacterium]|nr:hypothetical protein [Bryobacteraceae bacterium]
MAGSGVAGEGLSRRSVLAGAILVSACGRKRGPRYQGWLFVASGGEKEIAVADLASFRRVAAIPLHCAVDQLFQSEPRRVFAVCRDARAIIEIDVARLQAAGRIAVPGKPIVARLLPGAKAALILADDPPALLRVDLSARRIAARLPLPGASADMDLSGSLAAVTLPVKNAVLRASLPEHKAAGITDVGLPCAAIRFRRDGKTILAGAAAAKEIISIDAATGSLLSRL